MILEPSSIEKLSFGELSLFKEHAVIECFLGEDIGHVEIEELSKVLFPYFKNRMFGLIANRVNQYSVNLVAISNLFSAKNLVAGAIIAYSQIGKSTASIEDSVIEGASIEVFSNLEQATTWTLAQVSNKKLA